jgi:nucleotide-binding universal stress UspA family protein
MEGRKNILPLQRILWPTDFSDASYEALRTADTLASHFSAELVLLHVIPPVPLIPGYDAPVGIGSTSYLEQIETTARESLDKIAVERISGEVASLKVVVHGNPPEEVVRTAAEYNADLIVIATHGLTGWRRFIFGSVAEKVIRMASCPVLSIQVPPEEGEG